MLQTKELADIDESVRALVRRAYDLGRSEALQKVVSVLNEDRARDEQLALMAPETSHSAAQAEANGLDADKASRPWWAWRVR